MTLQGFAFQMDVAVEIDGGDMMMTYAGDGLFNYSSATLNLATPQRDDRKEDHRGGQELRLRCFDRELGRIGTGCAVPSVSQPQRALRRPLRTELSNSEAYGQLSLMGSEVLDGVGTHVISVRLDVDRTNAYGGLDVVYWVGIEDGLLRQVRG